MSAVKICPEHDAACCEIPAGMRCAGCVGAFSALEAAKLEAQPEQHPLKTWIAQQEELGPEFSKVLYDNLWGLYSRSAAPALPVEPLQPKCKECDGTGFIDVSGFGDLEACTECSSFGSPAAPTVELPVVPAGWNETVEKLCEDWGMERGTVTAIFDELLPHWHRDPSQTHIWISLDSLTSRDDYGVYGSDFYRCRICDAESGAGVLNKGIPHMHDCPLHEDNFGKLIVAPVPDAKVELPVVAWIPVKERLPECDMTPNSFGVQVLVHPPFKSDGASDMHVGFYGCRQTDKPNFYMFGRIFDPTHWMPLPASPDAQAAIAGSKQS